MSHEFDAIYDHGVFRPLEPLVLADGQRVHLRMEEDAKGADQQALRRAGPGLCKGMISIVADDEQHLKDFQDYMP